MRRTSFIFYSVHHDRVFGLNALYSLFNVGKNLYHAWTTKNDNNLRNQYLKEAAIQTLSIVTFSLALVVSLFTGLKANDALHKVNHHIFKAIESAVNFFRKPPTEMLALTISAVVGIAVNTVNLNKETFNAFKHPITTIKNIREKEGVIRLLARGLFELPFRLVALAIGGPLQVPVIYLKKLFTKNTNNKDTVLNTASTIYVAAEKEEKLNRLEENKDVRASMLRRDLLTKINKLLTEYEKSPSDKRKAKIIFIALLLKHKFQITFGNDLDKLSIALEQGIAVMEMDGDKAGKIKISNKGLLQAIRLEGIKKINQHPDLGFDPKQFDERNYSPTHIKESMKKISTVFLLFL